MIEKLDPLDTRPSQIIEKLNELIEDHNTHYHVYGEGENEAGTTTPVHEDGD